MAELAHLKVKLGLRQNGHADYPDFNELEIVKDSGMDWAYYIDGHGLGWCFDKCGHKENEPGSPRGMQWACLCILQEFVDQAVEKFPKVCEEIIEEEYEDFHDIKAHGKDPEELFDKTVLDGIKMKQDMKIPLTPQQLLAIDPDSDELGITKNKNKYWRDVKLNKGVTCVAKERVGSIVKNKK
jgi:hypothetical protein